MTPLRAASPGAARPTQKGKPFKPGVGARVLRTLAESGACVTIDELAESIAAPRKQITARITSLITNGYVRRQTKGCYEITAKGRVAEERGYKCGPQQAHSGVQKPLPDTFRARLWRGLRIKRKATVSELIANAVRPDEDAQKMTDNAMSFMRLLRRAGAVRVLKYRAPATTLTSNGEKIYLLVNDLGPKCPRLRKGALFNPNTNEALPLSSSTLPKGGGE